MYADEATPYRRVITELVFLLDSSGSMAGLEIDTINECNALIKQYQQREGRTMLSTVLFDHETRVLHDRVDIRSVVSLTCDDYFVRGRTALFDAVGGTIGRLSMVQRYLPFEYKPVQTIVVIATDGMENASCRYTCNDVIRMIHECELSGWEFLFLGANIYAAVETGKMGVGISGDPRIVADESCTKVLHEAAASVTCTFRSERTSRTLGIKFQPSWAMLVVRKIAGYIRALVALLCEGA